MEGQLRTQVTSGRGAKGWGKERVIMVSKGRREGGKTIKWYIFVKLLMGLLYLGFVFPSSNEPP